jgi:peptide/nickel transport system permease protein
VGAGYAARRAAGILPTLFSILVLTFLLVHASPIDPSAQLAGEQATPARIQEIRHSLGLDQPLSRQFITYVDELAHGNLGRSSSQGRPVSTVIAQYIGPTLLLTGAALFVSTVLGILLGAVAARYRRGPVDLVISSGSLLGYAVPAFWLGQIAIIVFGVHLGVFPLQGYTDVRNPPTGWHRFDDIAYHLVLPALVLATSQIALVARVTRSGLARELDQEYVLAARAKGLSDDEVVGHHAMRNVMLPIATLIGARIGFLLSGAVLVETVFSWPGLGSILTLAAKSGDSPLVLGVVLVIAACVLTANLLTDLLYGWIDPRARAR